MKKSIVCLFILFLSQTVWAADCPLMKAPNYRSGETPYSSEPSTACLPDRAESMNTEEGGIDGFPGSPCRPGWGLFVGYTLGKMTPKTICLPSNNSAPTKDQAKKTEETEEEEPPPEEMDYAEKAKECKSKRENTEVCCGNPIQCVNDAADLGIDLPSGEEMSMLTEVLGSGAAALGVHGAQQSCSKLDSISKIVGAVNGGLGALCQKKIMSCRSSCDELAKSALEKRNSLNVERGNHGERSELHRIEVSAKNNSEACSDQSEKVRSYAAAMLQAINVAAQAKLCKEAAQSSTDALETFDKLPVESCADPIHSEHPTCKNCNDPKVAAINPNCTKNTDGQGSAQVSTADYGDRASKMDPGSAIGGVATPLQSMNPQNAEAQAARANFSDQKGGRVPGGDMPSGGGGGARSGSYGQAGFDTDIIGGTGGSSGGYSNKAGRNGYGVQQKKGSRFGMMGNKKGSKFNLSSYLPGGAKDPNRRIASQRRIAGKYDDIFRRITKRVYHLCGHNRLYDCSNYKGRKPQGL